MTKVEFKPIHMEHVLGIIPIFVYMINPENKYIE
jgi:hypothetical protein